MKIEKKCLQSAEPINDRTEQAIIRKLINKTVRPVSIFHFAVVIVVDVGNI